MNIADACVAGILVLGLLGGARRGLSGELLRIITIAIAIMVGWQGAGQGAEWLAGHSDWSASELKPAAFFGLILATYVFLAILRFGLRMFLDFSFKGKLELLGGALIGLLRAAVFSTIVLLGASFIPSEGIRQAVHESRSGTWVIAHIRPLYDDLVVRNPEFMLPELPAGEEEVAGLETPAVEEFLGPLIEPEQDGGE